MRILVAVKRVVDYNVKVHVLPDHSDVDTANVKMSMNPFDEIAVEQAVRLKEAGKADEVVAVSIGPDKTLDTLRVAMAMGADRAVHIKHDDVKMEPAMVAKLLAAVVKREEPGLVLLGKQAIDNDAGQVPQMLSALLDMPVAINVSSLEIEGNTITCVRETDTGLMKVKGELPAVVSADLRLAEPRYVTLPNMMKAKRKPIDAVAAEELAELGAKTVEMIEAVEPPARSAGVKLSSVDELIDVLKNTAKVL